MKTIEETVNGKFVVRKTGRINIGPFDTAREAKHYDLQAVRVYDGTERPFSDTHRLHLALAEIEARHNKHNDIVAVGDAHYLIRRNRYGVEVPIKYKVHDGIAHARNDSEAL